MTTLAWVVIIGTIGWVLFFLSLIIYQGTKLNKYVDEAKMYADQAAASAAKADGAVRHIETRHEKEEV